METRVALISIIVEKFDSAEEINSLLHKYGEYIIGRMGLPYKQKKLNIISVVVDAPQPIINSLSGKLGMIKGVKSKVLTAK